MLIAQACGSGHGAGNRRFLRVCQVSNLRIVGQRRYNGAILSTVLITAVVCWILVMQIRLLGEVSFTEMRQALFEALNEIEDEFAIRYSRGAVLFINPTDGLDENVVARNRLGRWFRR